MSSLVGPPARMRDIARTAGLSPATVDRALHHRPGVRARTRARVLEAAVSLGYIPESELASIRPQRCARLAMVLPAGSNQYLALLARTAAGSAAELEHRFNASFRVQSVPSFNPTLLARELLALGKLVDGIAFMAIEHPAVREAVNLLAERGTPTVTLISDLAGSRRTAYLGLENRAAGRTAAALVARFLPQHPAKVALIAGSRSYRAHEEREMGFLHYLETASRPITVIGLREGQDDEARNRRHARTLLAEHPDLAAIYNIGGAPEGVARALKDAGRERSTILVGHGLTASTRRLLLEGTVDAILTQDPRDTVLAAAAIFDNLRAGRDPTQALDRLRTEIILCENLP